MRKMERLMWIAAVVVLCCASFIAGLLADEPYTALQTHDKTTTPEDIRIMQFEWDRDNPSEFYTRFVVISNGIPIEFLWVKDGSTNWAEAAVVAVSKAEYKTALAEIGVTNATLHIQQTNRGFERAIKKKMPIQ